MRTIKLLNYQMKTFTIPEQVHMILRIVLKNKTVI